jgi:hypothetical protein
MVNTFFKRIKIREGENFSELLERLMFEEDEEKRISQIVESMFGSDKSLKISFTQKNTMK